MLVNVLQLVGARLGVHCTWNRSLLGANHVSRKPNFPPMLVATMPEMKIGGFVGEIGIKWKSTSMAKFVTAKLFVFCTPRKYVEPGTSGGTVLVPKIGTPMPPVEFASNVKSPAF